MAFWLVLRHLAGEISARQYHTSGSEKKGLRMTHRALRAISAIFFIAGMAMVVAGRWETRDLTEWHAFIDGFAYWASAVFLFLGGFIVLHASVG